MLGLTALLVLDWRAAPEAMELSPGGCRLAPMATADLLRRSRDGASYRHGDGSLEWFRRRGAALEHGFVLPKRPEAAVQTSTRLFASAPVRLTGDRLECGEATYGALRVTDAVGAVLPARLHFESAGSAACPHEEGLAGCVGVRVEPDVLARATFPVEIDPLLTTPSWSFKGRQAGELFGSSVAGVGDVNGDGFDDVVVGARGYSGEHLAEGRVLLFYGSDAGLQLSPGWAADPVDQDGGGFGFSVAGLGDVNGDGFADFAAGAPGFSGAIGATEGRVYVYFGSDAGPGAPAVLNAGQRFSSFGQVVAGAGDVNGDGLGDVIGCAPYWDDGGTGALNAGRAAVYFGRASGLPAFPDWTAVGASLDSFCFSAGSTDTNADGFADLLFGSYGFNGEAVDEGRASLFRGGPTGPEPTPVWVDDPLDQATARFGASAGVGDVDGDGFGDAVVGAWAFDAPDGAVTNSGLARLYSGSTGRGLTRGLDLAAPTETGAAFGYAVSGLHDVTGDGLADLVVGAFGASGSSSREGVAFVTFGRPGRAFGVPWRADPADQLFAQYSNAVGAAGDVNGDGFNDLIVSAHIFDVPRPDGGVLPRGGLAVLHLGGAEPLAPAARVTLAGARFATFVGDVTADGVSDVVVAAAAGTLLGAGSSFEFGPVNAPGPLVAAAGDLDGDGAADFAIAGDDGGLSIQRGGAQLGSPPLVFPVPVTSMAGRCDVDGDTVDDLVLGDAASGTVWALAGWRLTTLATVPGIDFGASVVCLDDVNLDGRDDFAVGAPRGGGVPEEGLVRLYLSRPGGWAQSDLEPLDEAGAHLGTSLAAGDFDGDGDLEVAAGAPGASPGGVDGAGAVVVRDVVTAAPALVLDAVPPMLGVGFGATLATADVTLDGRADLLVGVPRDLAEAGQLYLFDGSSSGLVTAPSWTSGEIPSGEREATIISAGFDVDDDGRPDVLSLAVSAPDGGRVTHFAPGGAAGALRSPRQLTVDGGPLAQGATTAEGVIVEATVAMESAVGGAYRLEVEVVRHGAPFGAGRRVRSGPAPGGSRVSVPLGVTVPGEYDWRARVLYPVGAGRGQWFRLLANGPAASFRLGVPISIPFDGGAVADGGIDGGEDGGLDGGAGLDGGGIDVPVPSDAGADVGGPGAYRVGCEAGCRSGPGAVLLGLALVLARRRR